jgi:hypothetical protein
MSLIYQKNAGASQEQCLILGPREALVYPFNFGPYQEIRFGILLSATSNSGPNSAYTTENVSFSSNRDKLFIGFKDSSSNFPFETGSSFIGIASAYNNTGAGIIQNTLDSIDASIRTLGGDANYSSSAYCLSGFNGNQALSGFNVFTSGPIRLPSPGEAVATSNYMTYLGGRLGISGSSFTFNWTYNTTKYSSGSQISIRTLTSAFPTPSPTLSGVLTGAAPDALFIYSPFKLNQLRIHGIVLDKYS